MPKYYLTSIMWMNQQKSVLRDISKPIIVGYGIVEGETWQKEPKSLH